MSTRRTFLTQSFAGLTAATSIPLVRAYATDIDAGDFKAPGRIEAVASSELMRADLTGEYDRSADQVTLKNIAPSEQKAVLVTGASTGIGRKITEYLAGKGYLIYAGARKDSDLKALATIEGVRSVRLDVTRPEDIAAAVEMISQAGCGLYGLVNNAGVATLGPLIDTSQEEFDLVMDVNVAGPFRITKAFAPLIIASKGRIVTIGSNAGILSIEGGGAYCMSKHAMEAFTDVLADEMRPHGVHVSIVEPGGYNSDIIKSAALRAGRDPGPANSGSAVRDPIQVAWAVELALFAAHPQRRYLVVASEPEADATIRKQIDQLVQLNAGQRYTYQRQTLIQMLDAALVHSLTGPQ